MINRRQFNQGLVALALGGLASHLQLANASTQAKLGRTSKGYGPLLPDPKGILDLPEGFSYQVISALGKPMADGLSVPDRADGMGCFGADNDTVVLVRNHEISPPKVAPNNPLLSDNKELTEKCYDTLANGQPLPGGTSNIVYNLKTHTVENEFMSLIGTIRNCAGGITPWNSWLTCEESVLTASDKIGKNHGYVFEVPATATELVKAEPIPAMGRFNHEAACVDPTTGVVYLTEDRSDSLFYRFIPNQVGNLHKGGKLQALAVIDHPQFDSRNWDEVALTRSHAVACEWLDLDEVESPKDDLRLRGYNSGAARFARGEGIHFGNNELYFCCTNGGNKKLGQIMRYVPSPFEGSADEHKQPGKLSLFVESEDKVSFNFGDNLTIAPNGHLIVCEDQYTDVVDNHLKGVTKEGLLYDFAKVRWQTEPAGACFSPDGSTMFVNLYSPTATLAITGPWMSLS
jgi:secreted PhoX family phosphatase